MSWEESKACTPLKRDFLRAWFAQERRFFLTGGSALGLFYLDHRRSYDLDLFTSEEVGGREVQGLVQRTASQIGAECAALRSAPDFHRFRLTRGEEREIIDVVVDRAPQLDAEKREIEGIRVDTVREIIANKLTTLLSRTEIKDVVDLYFLEQAGYDLLAALPDASAKDAGWEPAVVAMLLSDLRVTESPAWMIKELTPSDLAAFLNRLRLAIAARALPGPPNN
ncbi:MAG: nucleotidyl transferase AbiEii/AbiGii toxin family protein [Limisphaerales bacterium]